jgi:hypothetical protein
MISFVYLIGFYKNHIIESLFTKLKNKLTSETFQSRRCKKFNNVTLKNGHSSLQIPTFALSATSVGNISDWVERNNLALK